MYIYGYTDIIGPEGQFQPVGYSDSMSEVLDKVEAMCIKIEADYSSTTKKWYKYDIRPDYHKWGVFTEVELINYKGVKVTVWIIEL